MRGRQSAAVPGALEVDARPAGAIQYRDTPRCAKAGIGRRGRRRKSLLILVESVERADGLEVPVALRVATEREAVREVPLGEIVEATGKACLSAKCRLARRIDVSVDAGLRVVVPGTEGVCRAHRGRDVVRELDLCVRHPGVKKSRR